jgi:hypothetical protein
MGNQWAILCDNINILYSKADLGELVVVEKALAICLPCKIEKFVVIIIVIIGSSNNCTENADPFE